MTRTEAAGGHYLIAAALGGVCGGLAAVLATRELPKLVSEMPKRVSEMKEHLHEICDEKCGCCGPDSTENADEAEDSRCA